MPNIAWNQIWATTLLAIGCCLFAVVIGMQEVVVTGLVDSEK